MGASVVAKVPMQSPSLLAKAEKIFKFAISFGKIVIDATDPAKRHTPGRFGIGPRPVVANNVADYANTMSAWVGNWLPGM